VILSRDCAAEAMAWTKAVMTRLGLTRLTLDLFVTALSPSLEAEKGTPSPRGRTK
jgi:hypothetical protein